MTAIGANPGGTTPIDEKPRVAAGSAATAATTAKSPTAVAVAAIGLTLSTTPRAVAVVDKVQPMAASGAAATVTSLVSDPPAVDFTKMFRGFATGAPLAISASGFIGSSTVGGDGAVEVLNKDQFRLAMHVRAPFHNSDKPMGFQRVGDHFVSGDGVKWSGKPSADGHSLELTNISKPKERIRLDVNQPGKLEMTTWGFGGDGKPLTLAVKH